MGILFLLVTLFLLVLLKITHDSVNGSSYSYGIPMEGFTTVSSEPIGELLIVKAEWCGHCKNAKPEFEKLLSLGTIPVKSGKSLKVKILDSDQDSDEVKKLQIRGFPTILALVNGEKHEYPGDRTADGVKEYYANVEF